MNIRVKVALIGFFFVSSVALNASAQTIVGPTSLKTFTAAFNDEFDIGNGAPLPNPANCPLSDLAASNISTAGYKTFLATALTAVSNSQNVTFVLSNTTCVDQRPMIIGFTINL